MVKVDPNADLFPEGLFLFEVIDCEQKYTKKGQIRFMVTLMDVHTNRRFSEGWMMEGNGLGMTVQKLKALGITEFDDIQPVDLMGRRAVARVKHKDSEAFGMQATIAKMWPESAPPKEWTLKEPEPTTSDPATDAFFADPKTDKSKDDDQDAPF